MHLRAKVKKGKLSRIWKHNQKVFVFYLKNSRINQSLTFEANQRQGCVQKNNVKHYGLMWQKKYSTCGIKPTCLECHCKTPISFTIPNMSCSQMDCKTPSSPTATNSSEVSCSRNPFKWNKKHEPETAALNWIDPPEL